MQDLTQRVAIVGHGAIFPGAPTPDAFWRLAAGGLDATGEPPPGRWPVGPADVYDPGVAVPDRVSSTRGGFIDGFAFDPEGLDLAPGLARRLDPMFHLALHAGRAAWRSARTENVDRDRVGVIFGNIVLPTETTTAIAGDVLGNAFAAKALGRASRPGISTDAEPLNRFVAGLPAGLLARALGLGGGAFTLDAACASSLYALKLAADELTSGRLDAVITGGLSRPDPFYTQMGFSQLRALSPSGTPRPFDARGDGLVVGEGCGLFVLKRLDDALRDGDEIQGVLAGVGLSNDVDGGLLAPSSEGQLRALRAAYERAGWRPQDVDLIECHATGTPVGDAVELASLKALWGESGWSEGACVVGSHKGNIGHALTASGSAGLLKLLLALKHQTLPPTAHFQSASPALGLEGGPFRVLKSAEPWRARGDGTPRRAAVSGFGFGGINAHALIEEWLPGTRTAVSVPRRASEGGVAVVGLGAKYPGAADVAAFRDRSLGLAAGSPPASPTNAWGVPVAEVGHHFDALEVPQGRFRVPPKELEEMLPQQALLLLAAADAIADAGWKGEAPRRRAGVFVGIGLDPNTTNFHVRWSANAKADEWARDLGIDPEGGEWRAKLNEAAGPPLTANRTMGALGGLVASRVAREFRVGGPSFTTSSEETSGLRALEVAVRMLERGELDEAVVGAVDLTGDPRWLDAAKRSGVAGLVRGDGAAALVLKRLADAERDGDHVHAVIEGVHGSSVGPIDADDAPAPPWGAASERASARQSPTPFGHNGAATGLTAVLRAVVSLDRRVLPPDGPAGPRFWLRDRAAGPRRATVECAGVDGGRARIDLKEHESSAIAGPSAVRPTLFVVEADEPSGIIDGLDALSERAKSAADVHALARTWWSERPKGPSRRLGLAVLGDDLGGLAGAVADARRALPNGEAPGPRARWRHNPAPLGGGVAFVYPALGNSFPGMARALSAAWPEVFHRLDAETLRLRSQLGPASGWEGGPVLTDDHRGPIMAQIVVGTAVTDLLGSFGVRPSAVLGYSLGESSALFATRAWADRDAMHARLDASPLFRTELCGPCDAARRAWGLRDDEAVDWVAGVAPCSPEAVRDALHGLERAYLLIINTSDECVIGGQAGDVATLVDRLGAASRFVALPAVSTVHCPVAREVEAEYRALHRLDATPPPGLAYYSAGWGRAYVPDRDSAADAIVAQAVEAVDFAAVVRQAHDDGIRTFLEVGPGSSCSRIIDVVLSDRPHFARSACAPGNDGPAAVIDLLARLVAERVPVDLSPLYAQSQAAPPASKRPPVVVPVGGRPFDPPPPPLPAEEARPTVTATTPRDLPVSTWDRPTSADPIASQAVATETARGLAHSAFLRASEGLSQTMANHLAFQTAVIEALMAAPGAPTDAARRRALPLPAANGHANGHAAEAPATPPPALDRDGCMEFAVGAIGKVLGPAYAAIDAYPTRVRLPDEPLMLVDRIVAIEGEPLSMTHGRVVTEHDVHEGAWYLDHGKVPPCISIESGQADLFLSAWLGADFETKGLAVYRLLDAAVTFHRALPGPGDVIRYDIRISQFFRQGDTHLFRFEFEGSVRGEPLLTMRDGCAGFFSPGELAAGQGVVKRPLDLRPLPGKRPDDWRDLAPMAVESYDDAAIEALRRGDYAGAFGPAFEGLNLASPLALPGGRMALIDRVPLLDPTGGRYGLGLIRGELDIHPDDWFLTCHFVDDQVMPGTLMYECCLHTLRTFLTRTGWVGEGDGVSYEPVPGVSSRLRCRGQVVGTTGKAVFEVVIKELGYGPEPYAVADALMYADGKPVVEVADMTLRIAGLDRGTIEATWQGRTSSDVKAPLVFTREQVLAFAAGKPSEAFGPRYVPFDEGRFVARLPAPPFSFIDRVVSATVTPFVMEAGGEAVAEYDAPADAWYFADERTGAMPFAVLQEVALQACGWTSAYMGSALTSPHDLHFRNLGGEAVALADVTPASGTLSTRVKATKVANSAGMVLQHYDFETKAGPDTVLKGSTYFGFFRPEALADQVGIREASFYEPTAEELARASSFDFPTEPPFPTGRLRMIDRVSAFVADGGPRGLGYIEGALDVAPSAWFFEAHFLGDPVCPGSLGLESFLQLLKVVAVQRWGNSGVFEPIALGETHRWSYRGQVVPADKVVTVRAAVTERDDRTGLVRADGYLEVDGRPIYQMNGFALRWRPKG